MCMPTWSGYICESGSVVFPRVYIHVVGIFFVGCVYPMANVAHAVHWNCCELGGYLGFISGLGLGRQ